MYVAQSIQRPQGVNAFGSCLIRAVPDFASVRCAVNRTAPHPKQAFEAARDATKRVRDAIRSMGIADADVAASDISLAEAFSVDGQTRKKIGYEACVMFHVIVRQLGNIEALLSAVVDAGADRIISVHAKTSKLREVRGEARERAVRAARAKAEELAAAAGAKLGPVLHLEDINADDHGRRSHLPDIDHAMHDDRAGEPQVENPGSIMVAAAVMACFALVP